MKKCSLFIIGFWLLAVFAGWLLQLDPNHTDLNAILNPPDRLYILGTDDLGRSIFARLLHGMEISFFVALFVTSFTMTLGVIIGLMAGFYGGTIDQVLMKLTDVFLAFPGILLAIAFAAVLGPGLGNLMIALCTTGWVNYARLTRGQTLSIRSRLHVLAAEALGASVTRIIFKHILPLMASILLVEATYSIAGVIIAEASLSFLGLGIQSPTASWGTMLRDGVRYILVAPHYLLISGAGLMSLILAINLGGDYLRDFLDVKTDV